MKNFIKSIIMASVVFSVLLSCKTFQGEIPIGTDLPDSIYISPINEDGVQDYVLLPVEIPDLKGLNLSGYLVKVTTDIDQLIFSEGTEIQKEKGIKGLVKKKKTAKVPKLILWDGKNNDGLWVSDGIYFITIEAWDYKNNRGTSEPFRVIVDNTAPYAELSLPYMFFSPNNDSNQDVLYINQREVSPETVWEGSFKNSSGNSVRSQKWNGIAPDFQWNGLDDKEQALEDGDYSYHLSSTDLAGNSSSFALSGIKIDNRKFPVSIGLPQKYFSPNEDGVKDTLIINLTAGSKNNITDSSAFITDSKGTIVRSYLFGAKLPDSFEFDGKNTDGEILAEDSYYCKLDLRYNNGDMPSVVSSPFIIDITKPYAVISKSYDIFSPDGDGNRDSIDVYQSTSVEENWTGVIESSTGNAVKKYLWGKRAIAGSWDGKDESGQTVSDGTYSYSLRSTDMAGNSALYILNGIRVDTRATAVKISASRNAISPNKDNIADEVDFLLQTEILDGIRGWNFEVLNEGGAAVYTVSAKEQNTVPPVIPWNGIDNGGKINEGKYRGKLTVNYEKGNISSSQTENFVLVDLTPPSVTATLSPVPFSPDDDGENDVLGITVKLDDPGGVKGWSSAIVDPAGNAFISIPSALYKNNTFKWDGKSSKGELVQSASDYKLIINSEDSLGNRGKTEFIIPIDILVIKEGDKLKISISSIYFKPFTADYLSVDPEIAAKNIATLDRLSVILKKYSNYKISLEGHAVRVYWDKDDKWLAEENEVLKPLSKKRSDVISQALTERGISAKRMQTAGLGGYVPIVPHSDFQNRWKNRRVEFILVK